MDVEISMIAGSDIERSGNLGVPYRINGRNTKNPVLFFYKGQLTKGEVNKGVVFLMTGLYVADG